MSALTLLVHSGLSEPHGDTCTKNRDPRTPYPTIARLGASQGLCGVLWNQSASNPAVAVVKGTKASHQRPRTSKTNPPALAYGPFPFSSASTSMSASIARMHPDLTGRTVGVAPADPAGLPDGETTDLNQNT